MRVLLPEEGSGSVEKYKTTYCFRYTPLEQTMIARDFSTYNTVSFLLERCRAVPSTRGLVPSEQLAVEPRDARTVPAARTRESQAIAASVFGASLAVALL